MFVFHRRELDALERADNVSALALARLVECVAFGTEPEWSANPLGISAFSRWLVRLPTVQGIAPVREALQHKVLTLAQALETSWQERFETTAGASSPGSELASVADQFLSDCRQSATRRFEAALGSTDLAEIVNLAAEIASLWISNLIHPQTIFKKLVGHVLDPESQQRDSTVQDRLKRVVEDFSSRVLQRHRVSVCIKLPRPWSPPEPVIAGVQADLEQEGKALALSTLVDATDPESAVWVGRALILRSLSTLRGRARDLELELPPTLRVTMPNGQEVEISCRLFRPAPPRLDTSATLATALPEDAGRFHELAGGLAEARQSFTLGKYTDAIVALWVALEQFIRLSSETSVPYNKDSTSISG